MEGAKRTIKMAAIFVLSTSKASIAITLASGPNTSAPASLSVLEPSAYHSVVFIFME